MKGKLEDKGYSAVKKNFSFSAAYIDWATGYSNNPKLATVLTIYSDLVKYSMYEPFAVFDSNLSSYNFKENIQKNWKWLQKNYLAI